MFRMTPVESLESVKAYFASDRTRAGPKIPVRLSGLTAARRMREKLADREVIRARASAILPRRIEHLPRNFLCFGLDDVFPRH